ncbi:hypothetical protein [Endozoicomonas sp. YOMI1]|uniref:hypothetical protein n=1 Tax=Endozoicomonas sp. YOMI1 TaxID=2828739 RepID=UPI002148F177|nr:hypothetical protein [Endozoicomonas sp. YOMI1]
MKKTLFAIVSSSVILFSANASADRDYAAQAMERHGMEKPVSMPVMNAMSTREALDSITVPTKQEELQARLEALAERREN